MGAVESDFSAQKRAPELAVNNALSSNNSLHLNGTTGEKGVGRNQE